MHDGDVAYFSVSCVGATRSRNLTLSRTDLRIALFAFTPSTRILLHISVEQFTALPLEPTKAMETLALETPTARSPQVDDEAKQLEPQDLDQGDEQISKTTDDMQEDVIRQSGAISPSSGEEDDVPKARKSTASKPSIEPADVTIISDSDDEPAAAEVKVDVKGKGEAKEEAPRSVMQAAHDSIYEPRRKPLFAPSTPLEPLLPRLKGKGQASLPKPRGKVKRKPTRLVSMASAMQTMDESDYDSEEERNRIRAVDVRLMRTRMRDEWSGMDAGCVICTSLGIADRS